MTPPVASEPPLGVRSGRVAAARRLLRKRTRRAQGRFLAEGPAAVESALATGRLVELFVTAAAAPRHQEVLAGAAQQDVPVLVVDEAAAAALSETVTPQGIVGVATLPQHRLDAVLAGLGRPPQLAAVLVDARDPGNAGTVIRTADAAGADLVVFAGNCVDPFGGKAVRASAGSVLHVPIVDDVAVDAALAALRAAGYRLYAAARSGEDLFQACQAGGLNVPCAWVFGNEAHGLPPDVLCATEAVLTVPVYGAAESLNLAAAAAICLYATVGVQRRG